MLVWNNKDYKFIKESDNYDSLEFGIVRKLFIKYIPNDDITIDFFEVEFGPFGSLEKIEIFNNIDHKIAHITYKRSCEAYFALVHFIITKPLWLVTICPAWLHLQPNRNFSETLSPLPADCLERIFNKCNIHDQAALAVTCEYFRMAMLDRIFLRTNKILCVGNNAKQGITTACRIMHSIGRMNVKISIKPKEVSLLGNIFYQIEIDFDQAEKILDIDEKYCYLYISVLKPFFHFFQVLILNVRENLRRDYPVIKFENKWKSVHLLVVKGLGHDNHIPHIEKLANLPNLTSLRFENASFHESHQLTDYLLQSNKLDRFELINCEFNSDEQFIEDIINKADTRSIVVVCNQLSFVENTMGSVQELLQPHSSIDLIDIAPKIKEDPDPDSRY